MKLIKNILIGLGVVFSLFIGLAVFLFWESSEFREKNEPFAREFTRAFSQDWSIGDVSDHVTNDLLAQINTPNGKHALSQFRAFGRLVKIEDVEMGNYNASAGVGVTGVLRFKAEFENVKALVTITLRETDGVVKVHGFHIDPLSDIKAPKNINA